MSSTTHMLKVFCGPFFSVRVQNEELVVVMMNERGVPLLKLLNQLKYDVVVDDDDDGDDE